MTFMFMTNMVMALTALPGLAVVIDRSSRASCLTPAPNRAATGINEAATNRARPSSRASCAPARARFRALSRSPKTEAPMFDKLAAYLEKRMEANAINPDPLSASKSRCRASGRGLAPDGHYDAAEQHGRAPVTPNAEPAARTAPVARHAEPRQANTWDDWTSAKPCARAQPGRTSRVIRDLGSRPRRRRHRMETMIDAVAQKLEIRPPTPPRPKPTPKNARNADRFTARSVAVREGSAFSSRVRGEVSSRQCDGNWHQ